MKKLLILLMAAVLCACQAKESKADQIIKLNRLVSEELDYQQQLGKQVTGNDSSDRYLFLEKEKSDKREDSLKREIEKINAE